MQMLNGYFPLSLTSKQKKKKTRNKLSHEVLNSICIIRSHLQTKEIDCTKYKCDEKVLSDMDYKVIYDHKT